MDFAEQAVANASGLWLELNNRPGYSKEYPTGSNDDLYRRSMYTFWKRTVPSPMLKTFDAPEREFCTVRRSRTNTPLQALTLLNDPVYLEAGLALAERILLDRPDADLDDQVTYGFRRCLARHPTATEVDHLAGVYRFELRRLQSDPKAVDALLKRLPDPAESDRTKLAAWSFVTGILLNLDEAITKE